ncbi:retrovirus-related pol polyprotein from transposon TNT 1-94, partial [Tanacetum coccineum]
CGLAAINGLMRVESINGKKYILVIVDDYSWFTWVKFLRSKDDTMGVLIKFLEQVQDGLQATLRFIRTNNGTEFMITMAYEQSSSGPALQYLTSGQISSELVPNPAPSTFYTPASSKQLDILLQPMFDEYFKEIPKIISPDNSVVTQQDAPSSMTIDQDAPSPTTTPIIEETQT